MACWLYGPNGEAKIFEDAKDAPKGWKDSPAAFKDKPATKPRKRAKAK